MQTNIEIRKKIEAANSRGDFNEVARLAQIASQLQKIDEQRDQLLAAVQSTPSTATSQTPALNRTQGEQTKPITRNTTRGGLTVELTSKGGTPIRICERTAAETMVVLMERILTQLGPSGLERLTGFTISRGPMVSRDPRKDYLNSRTGNLYAHHRIPGSDLYVLTHSDSQQKVKDVKAALKFLGFAPGTFRVTLDA